MLLSNVCALAVNVANAIIEKIILFILYFF
jgi:hypothetical protein